MTDDPHPSEQPTVMGLLAQRCRLSEGQLYTCVLAVLLAALLTIGGLPNARQHANDGTSPANAGAPAMVAP